MEKTKCIVCDGKGGWKIPAFNHLDKNWEDCMLCDGFGFYDKNDEEEEKSTLLDYTKQISTFRAELEKFGRVFKFEVGSHGSKIDVNIVPTSRDSWIKLVKKLLFVASGNELCDITPKQVFFYGTDGKYKYYWELLIEVKDLIDLEILSDYIASLEGEEKNV